jgi:hypothetical protein
MGSRPNQLLPLQQRHLGHDNNEYIFTALTVTKYVLMVTIHV